MKVWKILFALIAVRAALTTEPENPTQTKQDTPKLTNKATSVTLTDKLDTVTDKTNAPKPKSSDLNSKTPNPEPLADKKLTNIEPTAKPQKNLGSVLKVLNSKIQNDPAPVKNKLSKTEKKILKKAEKKIKNLPKKKKRRLLRQLGRELKQFNKKSDRKLIIGDMIGSVGEGLGSGAGMLGAGAGLMMATMGSDKEQEERETLEAEVRNKEMALMMVVNKRGGELGSLEAKVDL